MPPLKEEDRLRNLAREQGDNMKGRYEDRRDELKGKYVYKKAKYAAKWRLQKRVLRRSFSPSRSVGEQRSESSLHHRRPLRQTEGTHKNSPEKNKPDS